MMMFIIALIFAFVYNGFAHIVGYDLAILAAVLTLILFEFERRIKDER